MIKDLTKKLSFLSDESKETLEKAINKVDTTIPEDMRSTPEKRLEVLEEMIKREKEYPEDDFTAFNIYEKDEEILDPMRYTVKFARLNRFHKEGKKTRIPDWGKDRKFVKGMLFCYNFYSSLEYNRAKAELFKNEEKVEELSKKAIETLNHFEAGYSEINRDIRKKLKVLEDLLDVYVLLELGYKSDAWKLYTIIGFDCLPLPDELIGIPGAKELFDDDY